MGFTHYDPLKPLEVNPMHKKFVGCNQLNVTKLSKRFYLKIGERKNGKSKFVRPLASNWSLPGGSNHLSVPKQVQTITEKSLWAATKVGHPPCRFTPVLQWTAENIFTYTQDLWDRWCRATRFSLRNITWNSMKWNTFKILFRF